MTYTIIPQVFVSAVSSDLRSARQVVNDALTRMECLPVEESVFGTEYGEIRKMLARKIDSCHAVIHLVGRDYGGEPDIQTLPTGQARRSWTQIEYDIARQKNKKLFIINCDAAFPFDKPVTQPPADQIALQCKHRESVLNDPELWHKVRTSDELRQAIDEMKISLDEAREELIRQQVCYRTAIGLVSLTIGLFLFGSFNRLNLLGKKVDQVGGTVVAMGEDVKDVKQNVGEIPDKIEVSRQEIVRQLTNPAAFAEAIRKQIREAADAKLTDLKDEKGRWRKEAEIEKERDLAIGRVDDLMKLIQAVLKEGASPVFQKATEILQKDGIDEALAYLETNRPSTLAIARSHAEQARNTQDRADAEKEQRNKSLQALTLEAELLETQFKWQPAVEIRKQIAELAPDWFDARDKVGELFRRLGRYIEAEPHLRECVRLAGNPDEEALSLHNLAHLLVQTNRARSAERLMRRAFAIDERLYGEEHPRVAAQLNNISHFLKVIDHVDMAEPLMRRTLTINERYFGADHVLVARDLSNLAQLFKNKSRLAEAEPLMRRALAIDEHHYGAEHHDVASDLNNLAAMLVDTNRLKEAEPLMIRALSIFEKSLPEEHPDVSTSLNNVAALLLLTERNREAEPLLRRALAIAEHSYGPEHPDVSTCLNNLVQSLRATKPTAKLEPLMRRVLQILILFRKRTGRDHHDFEAASDNYRLLLKLPKEKFEERFIEISRTSGPLSSIVPEIERLYGPAQAVGDVLTTLKQQRKENHESTVYFLSPEQAMTPQLKELFQPNANSLYAAGVNAFRDQKHADAIINFEESLKLITDKPDKASMTFSIRMNRAAALRELGDARQARDELRLLLEGLKSENAITALYKGRARYHLALCEWRLDNRDAAQREAEESLREYGDDEAAAPQMKVTKQLLADMKEHKPFSSHAKADATAALEQARARFRARVELASLPLNQSALPLLDQMLGPSKSTKEVFEILDRQYRDQDKPSVWLLPVSQPIAPHLDELLGPIPAPVQLPKSGED